MILVTGAAGFIGRRVVKALVERGKSVRAIVRIGKEDALKAIDPGIEVITTSDLFAEEVSWWKRAYRDIDTVIHIAGVVSSGSDYLSSPKNVDCLFGVLQMARAVVGTHVRRFIGVGSAFEYDSKYGAALSVDTPLRPTCLYASAKVAAFYALRDFFAFSGIESAWCRPFNLFSGDIHDCQKLERALRENLSEGKPVDLGRGTQVRDFMDVRDAGRDIAEVALGSLQGAFNICSGIPTTIRAFAERVADEYGGRRDLLRFNKRPDNDVDFLVSVGVKNKLS